MRARMVRLLAEGVNVTQQPEFEWMAYQTNKGRCSNEVFLDANEGDGGRTIRCTLPLSHSGDHEYRHAKVDGSYLHILWCEKRTE